MNTVLIVNHKAKNCGVYQFGKRVYSLVENSNNVNYIYREFSTMKDFTNTRNKINPDFVVFNYHYWTMQWLLKDFISNEKHYFIFHDDHFYNKYDKYLFFGARDLKNYTDDNKSAILPRPIFESSIPTVVNTVPTIGSFGFGFMNKGFHKIVEKVNKEFDKAIINLHIPVAEFSDPKGIQNRDVVNLCRKLNTKPEIKLNITNDFKSDEEILEFLSGNDINVFMYGENGDGISSVLDFALSVNRPIALSNCLMFRHIYSDCISTEKNSLSTIIKDGNMYLDQFRTKWSVENFRKEMDNLFV